MLPNRELPLTHRLSLTAVTPNVSQVERLVGLRANRPAPQRVRQTLDELLHVLPRLLRPRGVLRIAQISSLDAHGVQLQTGITIAADLRAPLANATALALFVVTIGSAVERLSRRWLRTGRIVAGTTLDALASESAEAACQRLREELRAWARPQGLDVTPPYSPGYCGIPLTQQRILFNHLPVHSINVHLTDALLMQPLKSISGLLGIGPAGAIRANGYACDYCDHPHCPQRHTAD